MIIDFNTASVPAEIFGDICIIGAGAAGITASLELSAFRSKVILLESGGLEYSDAAQNLYAGTITGDTTLDLDASRVRYLGGSTNHWAGHCRPLERVDFEKRSWIPDSGWPISFDDVKPYYPIAHRYCQVGPFDYEPALCYGGVPTPSFVPETDFVPKMIRYSPPTRFGETYREALAENDSITCYLNANFTAWNTSENGAVLESVTVRSLDGASTTVRARYFILATGGIENARLLLQPAQGHPNGVGNQEGLVGRYYADHSFINNPARAIIFRNDPAFAGFQRHVIDPSSNIDGHLFLSLSPELQEREALPQIGLRFTGTTMHHGSPGLASARFIKESMNDFRWPRDLGYHLQQVVTHIDEVLPRLFGTFERETSDRVTDFWCELPPNPESRVLLGDETDALGLRRVNLRWLKPDVVKRAFFFAHETLGKALGESGLGRLQIVIDEEDMRVSDLGGNHHMGTTRMHEDPKRGVVNADCRVHGVDNLYVAGSSVFPTYGHIGPTLTLVALAARMAEHLGTRMRSH
jgi:choline dehydrogenase-like flavoprotein